MPQLTEDQKRHLRRLGHSLKPVVRLGGAGLTPAVMNEIEIALGHHELIKVKLAADDRAQRQALIETITAETGAALVQGIGNVALIYRANPEKKKRIALP